ncbi:MAG: adenylate kinase [Eubacteriales bacterium]
MKIMFLGAPGAGKGTQAENAAKVYQIPAISTGAIIREAIKTGTPMGVMAKSYTESGALVPDEVVIGIVKERLAQDDCKRGFILDGFPRTVAQAEALDAMGVDMDVVVSIEVPDEAIVERMSGRRVCDKCGASYHVKYKPSKDGQTCDNDGTPLTLRKDDSPEVVLDRLKTYHAQTEPLKDYYQSKGKLRTVIGQEEVSDTTKLTLAAIDSVK